MHSTPIAHALESVVPGPDVPCGILVMLPLLSGQPPSSPPPGYLVLDEGLAAGVVKITEISDAGRVPELRVVNRAAEPVLIVDGEELVGAKQNRVVNLTILVAANSTLTVPVSCVEAGRWHARSRSFAAASWTQYAKGRANRMADVTVSMLRTGDRASDQAGVWADIAEKSARLDSASPTGAMRAIFDRHESSVTAYVERCRPVDRQVGALFIVAGRIVGLDLFDSEATLRRLLPKLVRSAAIEAVEAEALGARPPEKPFPMRRLAEHFLSSVAAAPCHSAPAVGLGEDVRLTGPGLTGAALADGGRVVHLAAFATP